MSYQLRAMIEDETILKRIYKLLNFKPGDLLIMDLKDNIIQIKKSPSPVPDSCRPLTTKEIGERISKAIQSAENGETYSEQEVWDMMDKLRSR